MNQILIQNKYKLYYKLHMFSVSLWLVKSKSEGFFRMMMMIVFRSVPRCFPLLGFSAAVISFPLGADQKPLRWWSGGLSLYDDFSPIIVMILMMTTKGVPIDRKTLKKLFSWTFWSWFWSFLEINTFVFQLYLSSTKMSQK